MALLMLNILKAFDTVDNEILLNKLKYARFSETPLHFVDLCLTNRDQKVKTNKGISSTKLVLSGVPQGSVYKANEGLFQHELEDPRP